MASLSSTKAPSSARSTMRPQRYRTRTPHPRPDSRRSSSAPKCNRMWDSTHEHSVIARSAIDSTNECGAMTRMHPSAPLHLRHFPARPAAHHAPPSHSTSASPTYLTLCLLRAPARPYPQTRRSSHIPAKFCPHQVPRLRRAYNHDDPSSRSSQRSS
uniref:Uncharacterized protein n=1 Tax=Hypholoma sublateritium (strain FD-334 SS-4) TaxID=945553 RepID=A0A0D2LQS5_HYPSF